MHTPGPWKVKRRQDPMQAETSIASEVGTVCRMYPQSTPEESAANARLIAASPDLLRLARAIVHSPPSAEDCTERPEAVSAYHFAAKLVLQIEGTSHAS